MPCRAVLTASGLETSQSARRAGPSWEPGILPARLRDSDAVGGGGGGGAESLGGSTGGSWPEDTMSLQ